MKHQNTSNNTGSAKAVKNSTKEVTGQGGSDFVVECNIKPLKLVDTSKSSYARATVKMVENWARLGCR